MILFQNNKTPTSLVIQIKANELEYTIVLPANFVLSRGFTIDDAKARIPIIIGLSNREKIKIRTHVVSSVYDYINYLKNLEND
jgi:hypothetical protein